MNAMVEFESVVGMNEKRWRGWGGNRIVKQIEHEILSDTSHGRRDFLLCAPRFATYPRRSISGTLEAIFVCSRRQIYVKWRSVDGLFDYGFCRLPTVKLYLRLSLLHFI